MTVHIGMPSIGLFVLMILCGISAHTAVNEPAVLKSGPYLFLDNTLIAEQSGLTRTVHTPERLPEAVVTATEDGNFQPYFTVIRDAETGRFRIWYNIPVEGEASRSHLATMESEDGINWIRPHRVLKRPVAYEYGASIIDRGPKHGETATRYLFGFNGDHEGKAGLQVAVSPDGLNWSMFVPQVLVQHTHDITGMTWDPIRSRYVALVSMHEQWDEWTERRRMPYQSVSEDLLHWRKPWPIITPEPEETGETQFYCMRGVLARGDLLIGMVKVLRDDLNAEPGKDAKDMGDMKRKAAGIGYTVLCWSHDGETWRRDTEPFLDRNRTPGTWDRAHAWVDCQLLVGDQIYCYYGGYARGHKVERYTERHIGMARMKRDRYVSLDAGYADGLLRTVTGALHADAMTVNAQIDGSLCVRVLDEDGAVIEGFDWGDCQTLVGDDVAIPVQWSAPLSTLKGRRISFEFRLNQAGLFSFDLF